MKRNEDVDYSIIESLDVIHVHIPLDLSRPRTILPFLIRFFQKLRYGKNAAYYSHTAVAIWHNNGLFVYEADPEIKKTPFEEWVKNKEISIGRIPFKYYNRHGIDIDNVITIAISKLGLRYDYFSLILFQLLLILTGKWFGTKNSNAFYCSEYTSWLIYLGTNLLPDWYTYNPAKSYKFFKDNGLIVFTGKAKNLIPVKN